MIGRTHLSEIEEHLEEHDETVSTLTVGDKKEMRGIIRKMEEAIDEKNWEQCRNSLMKLKRILSRSTNEKAT